MIEERYLLGENDICSAARHLLNIGSCLGSNEFYEDTGFKIQTEKEHCWVDRLTEQITLGFEDWFEPKGFSKQPHFWLLEYWAILPCIYECGAVLGRARKDKIELLELIIPIERPTILALCPKPIAADTSMVNSAKEAASLRLNEFKTKESREPQSVSEFITSTVVAKAYDDIIAGEKKSAKRYRKLPLKLFSLNEAYPYLRAFLLEGVGFGSTFPELIENMFRKRYESIDMAEWNKSKEEVRQEGMLFPEEPTIIKLEALERDILITVAVSSEDRYPQLLEPLDLVPFSYSFMVNDCSRGTLTDRVAYMLPGTFEAWVSMFRCLLSEP